MTHWFTSARRIVAHRLSGTDLPPEIQALIAEVTARSRLKKHEQLGVADELIAHFRDGQEDGHTWDELRATFGNPRHTARLIRRGKVRLRAWWWHALRYARWAIGILMLIYLGLATRFYFGKPTIATDYVAKLNAPVLALSEGERAWPIYREAVISFIQDPFNRELDITVIRPGDQHWPEVVDWLQRHAADLDKVRSAATRLSLGFVLGRQNELIPGKRLPTEGSPSSRAFAMPILNDMRSMAQSLAADLRLAVQQRDGDRAYSNCVAMMGMARQMRHGTFINQLVSLALCALAQYEIEATLVNSAQIFSDEQWQRLSTLLVREQVANDLIDLDGEHLYFHDVLQHIYTDDGDGDGRITFAGMQEFTGTISTPSAGERIVGSLLGPIVSTRWGSRKEAADAYEALLDQLKADMSKPLRQTSYGKETIDIKKMGETFFSQQAAALKTSLHYTHQTCERILGHRDGLVLGIALERHHRQHGTYPEALDALVPEMLADLPVDRINGQPLHYKLIEGKPLIYSVGADGDDDGGRPYQSQSGSDESFKAAAWDEQSAQTIDGDWILFPSPRNKRNNP